MNKYKEILSTSSKSISQSDLLCALETTANWEDRYWLIKIAMNGDCDISDEVIIDSLEYCLFAGLTIANKDIYYDVNECLAKLYIRYGLYNEAQSKLIILVNNYDCPDWVHLYFATTQLHTMFERIVEEPKFFFERLLSTKAEDIETKREIQNIFGKFLCSIVEQKPDGEIATIEIVRFAKKIRFTQTEEFKLFHNTICPNLAYLSLSDESETIAKMRASEAEAKKRADELEAKLFEARRMETEYRKQLEDKMAVEAIHREDIAKRDKSIAELKSKFEAEQAKARKAEEELLHQLELQKAQAEQIQQEKSAYVERQDAVEAEHRKEVEAKNNSIAKLENEKSLLTIRLQELEQAKKTELAPQSIDDVLQQITSWLNCGLRRYLAQWLTSYFEKTCKNDYWNKKVKPALHPQEVKKFHLYKELTDFALDAVLNIYYYNFNDFYNHNSMAKADDRERLQEMQQIRNRWIGHFEENSWTKEKILFDIDTIIEFIDQIEMPKNRQKEYLEFRAAVVKMQ